VCISSFRRGPCIDGYAVDAGRVFQIMENVLYLVPIIKIIGIDIYAVADIVYGEFFSFG